MEVRIIRLSRPLLLASEKTIEGGYLYQTIYGFVTESEINDITLSDIDEYVGYLAALHLYYNGFEGKDFTIKKELREEPYWTDKEGVTHTFFDPWMDNICQKAKNQLNLSYRIISMDWDEDEYSSYVNEDKLLIDEEYYYYLYEVPELEIEPGSEPETEEPIWENIEEDELPF